MARGRRAGLQSLPLWPPATADRESDLVCGVDEAGRGPLAGPVVAAAVVLEPDRPIAGVADSKCLSPRSRGELATRIRREARGWAIGVASVEEIDRLNILNATLLAMQRAVAALALQPTLVLVDGNRLPVLAQPARAIVRGDASVAQIAAASILAKVHRDALMDEAAIAWPEYGFERHRGYPTADHLASLRRHGACPMHRRSFAPVRGVLGEPGPR